MRAIDAESLDFKWLNNLLNLSGKVEDYILETPTLNVIPLIYGEWEHDIDDIYTCSVCKRKTHVEESMNIPQYKYCPYCGAIMPDEKYGGGNT